MMGALLPRLRASPKRRACCVTRWPEQTWGGRGASEPRQMASCARHLTAADRPAQTTRRRTRSSALRVAAFPARTSFGTPAQRRYRAGDPRRGHRRLRPDPAHHCSDRDVPRDDRDDANGELFLNGRQALHQPACRRDARLVFARRRAIPAIPGASRRSSPHRPSPSVEVAVHWWR